MTDETRAVVFVCGMHRSGTSALTRTLNLLGLGLPDDLIAPVPGNNDLGFWESRTVVATNDQMLEGLGSRWDDEQPLSSENLENAANRFEYETVAAHLLTQTLSHHPQVVIKDPRLSRLMPVWRQAAAKLDLSNLAVAAVRHPVEVAASLAERDGFSQEKSLRLWLTYYAELLKGSDLGTLTFVDFSHLLEDWKEALEPVLMSPHLSLEYEPYAENRVEEFLSPAGRHHVAGKIEEHAGALEDLAVAGYELLTGGATAGQVAQEWSELPVVADVEASYASEELSWNSSQLRQSFGSSRAYLSILREITEGRIAGLQAEHESEQKAQRALARGLSKEIEQSENERANLAKNLRAEVDQRGKLTLLLDAIRENKLQLERERVEASQKTAEIQEQLADAQRSLTTLKLERDTEIESRMRIAQNLSDERRQSLRLRQELGAVEQQRRSQKVALLGRLQEAVTAASKQQRLDRAIGQTLVESGYLRSQGSRDELTLGVKPASTTPRSVLDAAVSRDGTVSVISALLGPLYGLTAVISTWPWRIPSGLAGALRCASSPLFHSSYYRSLLPSLYSRAPDLILALHYCLKGYRKFLSPNALVSEETYWGTAGVGQVPAFLHYVQTGAANNVAPHPLLRPDRYIKAIPSADGQFLHHYTSSTAEASTLANPIFHEAWYLSTNPDVAASGDNPISHFDRWGWKEGRRPHPLFDPRYYLQQNPDVEKSGLNPLTHFCVHGAAEQRNPHPLFDIPYYRSQLEIADDVNPLTHYLETGWRSGLSPHPLFDSGWYLRQYPLVGAAQLNPLIHFLESDPALGIDPGPWFSTSWYRERHELDRDTNALLHYVTIGADTGLQPSEAFGADEGDAEPGAFEAFVISGKWEADPDREPPSAIWRPPVEDEAPRTDSPNRPGDTLKPAVDSGGTLRYPTRRVGDGRRFNSIAFNRDHFWYAGSAVQELLENSAQIQPLPPWVRRLLVVSFDYELFTGVTRSISHYLNALVNLGGCEITSVELAAGANLMTVAQEADAHDVIVVNSMAPLLRHEGARELIEHCGPGRVFLYLHETQWTFEKAREQDPGRFAEFIGLLPDINLLCVSQKQRDWLEHEYGAVRSQVVREVSPPASEDVAGGLAPPGGEGEIRIGMAGTIQPRKGVDLFSAVADLAKERGLPWRFWWAGPRVGAGPCYESENVQWLGRLDDAEMAAFLRHTDIFFLSSEDDPYPLCALEALYVQTQVVAYENTGTAEVLERPQGAVGQVFKTYEPEEALDALRRAAGGPPTAKAFEKVNQYHSLTNFVSRVNGAIGAMISEPETRRTAEDASKQVAVVLHLYYHELWDEIRSYLANLRHLQTSLFVTLATDKPEAELARMKERIIAFWPDATVLFVENRGLDAGAFVEVVNHIEQRSLSFDLVLKLHAKRSLAPSGETKGTEWRTESLAALAGNPTQVDRILSIFDDHPEVGMIGPHNMLMGESSNDQKAGRAINLGNMTRLAQRMDIDDVRQHFFRGTMFWSRASDMFDPILRARMTIEDFDADYAPDGTLAHAMERMFACMVRSAGHKLHRFDPDLPKSIELLKNRHEGKDIYVVAAGPSAELIPREFLADKIVIGVNRVFVRFPCTYTISKEYADATYEKELENSGAIPVTAKWDTGNIFQGKMRKNALIFRRPEYYFFDHQENLRETVDLSVIQQDSRKLVVSFSTITSAMHLAAHMGAASIHLIGHDCGLLNGKAVFDGYYRDMTVSPWESLDEYKAWLEKIESQTRVVRDRIRDVYGCTTFSVNPFVNFGLEGNSYTRNALPE